MTKPHNYPEVLKWIAEGKLERIVYRIKGEAKVFRFTEEHPHAYITFLKNTWSDGYVFELEPETMTINGHEVPEPERQAPANRTKIFIPSSLSPENYVPYTWDSDSSICRMFLKRGVVHLNKEAAIAHSNALLSFTEVNHGEA